MSLLPEIFFFFFFFVFPVLTTMYLTVWPKLRLVLERLSPSFFQCCTIC